MVKVLDKLLPKLLHVLNGGATLKAEGVSHADALESAKTQQAGLLEASPGVVAAHRLLSMAVADFEKVGGPPWVEQPTPDEDEMDPWLDEVDEMEVSDAETKNQEALD